MTESQKQLQNALLTTFYANLVFLSEYDKELYLRVDELSRMIENGTYKEKYALEFIMEAGDFDIYDIVNDKYLYNKRPDKVNSKLIKEVVLDDKNSIISVSDYFTYNNYFKLKEDLFNLEELNETTAITINDAQDYKQICGEVLKPKKKLKEIRKLIFFGILSGRHIPKIVEKVNATTYLVLERNLEIFRLSLFTVDYTVLAKNGAVFSIMEDTLKEEEKIRTFLEQSRYDNNIIKISSTSINIKEYIDNVLSSISMMSPEAYDYNRMLYIHINRTTKYIKEAYKFMLFKKLKAKLKFFKDLPILYIAAGPSFSENIEWIKSNQDKFFIATIGSSLKKLLNSGIRVDLITTVDEQYFSRQFDDESIKAIYDKTIVLASSITNATFLKKFNPANLFLLEVFSTFHKDSISYSGFSVGELTIDILLQLNAKKIYIIGLDLALNQKTGETHSSDAASKVHKLDLSKEQKRDTFELIHSLLKVKGNRKKMVYTNPVFYSSIKQLEYILKFKNKDTKIYNLSSHGAYFKGTIPRSIKSIKIEDFETITKDFSILKNELNKYSRKGLLKEKEKTIKKELEYFKSGIEKLLLEIEEEKFKDLDSFIMKALSISTALHKKKFFYFEIILANYLEIICPYLLYSFNDKNLKRKNKKLEDIKKVFLKHIRKLIKDYILCLERLV